MSLAQSIGNYLGNLTGEIDIMRRSKPNLYRTFMQIVGTIISLIWINSIISHNVMNQTKPIDHNDLFMKRILSIPISIIIGWMIGFLAEMSVFAQLAQAKQNCLYKGFKPGTNQFNKCIDNVNFHLQNKNDILHRLN